MSKITTYPTMNINEVKDAIKTIGTDVTIMIMSEPGCGKTSILKDMAVDNGDQWRKPGDYYETDKYDYVYIDGPNKEIMDLAATIPNHETKSLEYYVSSIFRLGNGKPKVIMIDEALKVPKLLQPIYTRMYLERTVGDIPLPEGSIVFGTSNNMSDGVGDTLPAHTANRLAIVQMQKPEPNLWLSWAGEAGISPVIRAAVQMFPRMLRSYRDPDQQDNPYIFQPSKPQVSFVSPRSLAKSDPIIKSDLSTEVKLALLAGTLGEAGARDMMTFVSLEKSVTRFEDIIADPEKVTMPNDIAPLLLMIFNALDKIETQDDLNKFQKFVNRIESQEVQAVWFVMLLRSPKARMARVNPEISKWALDNHYLL
jgi:hypothetical protein